MAIAATAAPTPSRPAVLPSGIVQISLGRRPGELIASLSSSIEPEYSIHALTGRWTRVGGPDTSVPRCLCVIMSR